MAPQQGTIPPPPPGFSPVTTSAPASPSASTSIPPPPPGFSPVNTENPTNVRDTAIAGAIDAGGALAPGGQGMIGVVKGLGDTAYGLGRMIPGVRNLLPEQEPSYLKSSNAEQVGGKVVENAGEFLAGDEALSGLSRAMKIVDLADKSPLVAKTLALAKEHPVLAKMISEGAKNAVTGGAQGAVKGSAEGDAKGGAAREALTAGASAVAGEALTPLAKMIGEKIGIGQDAITAARVGAKPAKRNQAFDEAIMRVAPKIDELNVATGNKAHTIEDWADLAKQARQEVYDKTVQPLLDTYGARPLSGVDVANRIRADIPEALKKFSPEKAAQVEEFANQFLPGQRFALNAQDAERYIQHMNAELTATGYWKLDPSARAALEKTNPDIIKWKAAGDAIRDELYSKLGDWQIADRVPNPIDMADAKKDYGALRNVESELRGQINVQGRQSPLSLKETIGLITGFGLGGPHGAAAAAVPIVDKAINSGPRSFGRAVKAISRPEAGLGPAIERTAGAAKEALPAFTGSGGRIFFTASDGSPHSIPDNENALAHAKSIDPGLTVNTAPQQ